MHITRYSWKDWEPGFVSLDGDRIELFDENIDFTIGERKCTGYSRNSKVIQCPNNVTVTAWKCKSCMFHDNFFMCMRCTGDKCLNEKRRDKCKKEKYFVYISIFDSLAKVGISQSFRLRQRLVEQGADFAAKVAFTEDGKTVRELEKKISKHLDITDRVRGTQKQKRLFGDPNISMKVLSSMINKLHNNGFDKHLINPEIYDLREYYRLGSVPVHPEHITMEEGVNISGTVKAVKGNIIILEKNDKFLSFNAHDMIGRMVN